MPGKLGKKEVQALLEKYQRGECTAREIKIIDRWYSSYDNKETDIPVDFEGQARIKREILQGIKKGISDRKMDPGAVSDRSYPGRRSLAGYPMLWKVAAVLIAALATAIYFQSIQVDLFTGLNSSSVVSGVEKGDGSKRSDPVIYLSDGSVVWLKGKSRLEYPERFNGANREVTLSGEAFFHVATDPERPFIIHSANFTTRVLGTAFNIKDYGEDDAHEVVVVDGKVMVSVREPTTDKVREVILQPNTRAVYFPRKNILTHDDAREMPVEILSKRKLNFEEVRLLDIITVLNAEYNADISLAHSGMNNCIITADLTPMDLDLGLEVISKAINAVLETRDGKHIVISGEGCDNDP